MLLIKEDLLNQVTQGPPATITDEWRKKDNKARALINLSLEDDQIINIKSASTAKETFDILKNIHERSNLSSKLFLLRKLYNTKLSEGGNMNNHITSILEIIDRLRAIGENISNSHIAALLLCSVPSSYDTLITALEARNEEDLNPEFIRSKLVDEYTRRVENRESPENVFKTFQKNRKYPQSTNFRKQKYCTNCKLSNHFRSECWHLNKQPNNNKYKYQGARPRYNNSSICSEKNDRPIRDTQIQKHSENSKNINTQMSNLALLASKSKNEKWIVDSGCSTHISNDINLFDKINEKEKGEVIIANGNALTSYGSGNINVNVINENSEIKSLTLNKVLYVPEIQTNLLSVKRAAQNDCTIIFEGENCHFIHKGKTFLNGKIKDNLYEVQFSKPMPINQANTAYICDSINCIQTWHKRLGHKNYDAIREIMSKNLALGINVNKCKHDNLCEICIKSKMTNAPYPKTSKHRATKVLELIHSDLCGPIQTPSLGGKTYLLTFIDDYSRYTFIYFLSHKSEVLNKFKEYVAIVNNKFGKKPTTIRSDNGGEYTSTEMENYLKELGITHELSVPLSPSQNGIAERKNRSLMEMTRSMLSEANLPHKFWAEAVNTANYLQNRLPTKACNKTPHELWTGHKPDLSNTKIFGCKAYAYIDKTKRGKLDDRGKPGIFVGYATRSKGYRIFTEGKNVIISRAVKFLENSLVNKNSETQENLVRESQELIPNAVQEDCKNNKHLIEIDINSYENITNSGPENNSDAEPRRSQRTNRGVPPERLVYLTKNTQIYEPKNWEDLQNINNPLEKENWLNAANQEIESLNQNKTWTLVEPPQGRKIIGCRWTFTTKYNSEGQIEKYKARLVAKGFSQKYGDDYHQTYAPVVSYTTIRTFLANAVRKQLNINHLDVKTAFLHGELEENIYMNQPEGFITPGNENKVCKLNKAIYGLKQAARAWHEKISKTLKTLGFTQCTSDQCLFKRNDKENTMFIIVYVDDILISGTQKQIDQIASKLAEEYEIKNLGDINYYLGINIRKTEEGNLALNQKLKIEEIVEKFKLNEAKPYSTPLEPGYIKLNDEENILPNNTKYRQAVGALLYLATLTRPDISVAVNILSRRCERPREKDWNQIKRTIRYLNATKDLELIISSKGEPKLTSFADADWAGDINDRKSTSGNLFLLGETPILWTTKKQNTVALSSAEAEFISVSNASQEILWLIELLNDFELPQNLPIKIFEDNLSCIKMIQSEKYTAKTRHIDIKHRYVRDISLNGIIDLQYCPTDEMTADFLTKPLPKSTFVKHRKKVQLLPSTSSAITGE